MKLAHLARMKKKKKKKGIQVTAEATRVTAGGGHVCVFVSACVRHHSLIIHQLTDTPRPPRLCSSPTDVASGFPCKRQREVR